MKTCLLDLNHTLVANSTEKLSPFTAQIVAETYRLDLIARLKEIGCKVILLTARPAMHSKITLNSIEEKTGWHPDGSFFNDLRLPPPFFKERVLVDRILPDIAADDLFAVESNPQSRAMFGRHGVLAMPYSDFMSGVSASTISG